MFAVIMMRSTQPSRTAIMYSPYTDDGGDQPFASASFHIDLGDIPVIGTNKFAVDYGKVCHSANVENCHA